MQAPFVILHESTYVLPGLRPLTLVEALDGISMLIAGPLIWLHTPVAGVAGLPCKIAVDAAHKF